MSDFDSQKVKQAGDYIRYLSLFGIENAKSGHPGLPLGCADLGVILYRYILRYSSLTPLWANRDRFVLSAGHGSILQYSLLHTVGYPIRLKDIANFRQMGSATPGHPEYEPAKGIETTTGPLGQGFANAVGLAIEGKMLAARFNKKNYNLFDYSVVTLAGDGCMMEGISYEAASIAGHLGLDNLIAVYDSNRITIDGSTDISFTEDIRLRFEAQNWDVDTADGEDLDAVYRKLKEMKTRKGKPKLLIVKTTIGNGLSKLRGTNKVHGAPAGVDEIVYFIQNSSMKRLFEKTCSMESEKLKNHCVESIAKKALPVESPEDSAFMAEALAAHDNEVKAWERLFADYSREYPKEAAEWKAYEKGETPAELLSQLLEYTEDKVDATRGVSGRILNLCAEKMPWIVGGSADLVESTKATVKGSPYISRLDFSGRNIAFGIREHAMGAVGNGLALSGNFIPFTSTFFTFFDYMKPSVRLAALMKLPHLFIFTHDSIAVGEDGPTHQPIEHLNSLRLIPDLTTMRPANPMETAFAYRYFLQEKKGPMALLCTRQNIEESVFRGVEGNRAALYENFKNGAYIFSDCSGKPDLVIAASGSEVGLALNAAQMLREETGKAVRVVSVPCLELFQSAPESYREAVMGGENVMLALVEAASYRGAASFFRKNMTLIDIESFGHSAPASKVAESFGFTPRAVAEKLLPLLKK